MTGVGPPGRDFVVRAPGRVNLIGEHIDYSLLPVLPMAIQLGTWMSVRPRADGRLRLSNEDTAYSDVELELSGEMPAGPGGDWGNYARGVVEQLVRTHGISVGADVLVGSDLPVAAGLSSSSSLSCGLALALLAANGLSVDPLELAGLVARAERYTGTRGGGMDQAVILCAREGHALHVTFAPLSVRCVVIPEAWVLLVAHSGVTAEKAGAAQATYNARTRECREALEAVWESTGRGEAADFRQLLELDHEDLLGRADEVLEPPLAARFRHTVTEGRRVSEAEAALAQSDLDAFGLLMCTSHESLRDDFEVSTPELDRLVELAVAAGAAGARLTGAGLGGAVLILCGSAEEERVRSALEKEYYREREGTTPLRNPVFRARASAGAAVASVS